MELYVIHDCTHVSAIRMVVTIPWGLYIYDDPSISDDCVHTLDIRFTDDPSYLYGAAHTMDPFI